MRASVLFLLILVTGSPATSHAEKVKTNQATNVLNRPGERATVIVKVKSGQAMTVLAKESRWLKVRVSGRTGWVPRSKVDATDEIVRNTRRRSFVDGRGTKRGFTGEEGPEDRIGADALGDTAPKGGGVDSSDSGGADDDPKPARTGKGKPKPVDDEDDPEPTGTGKSAKGGDDADDAGEDEDDAKITEDSDAEDDRPKARVKTKAVAYNEADDDSGEKFRATSGTVLFPTGVKKGKFTEVENEEGDIGFVLTSKLAIEEPAGIGGPRTRQIDVRARLGFSFFQQGLRTPGAAVGVPNNYNIATSAAAIAVGGALLYPVKTRLVVGGEVTYDYAKAIPGIKVMNGSTSVGLHHLRGRGMVGYDLKRRSGMMVFGRLGVHYQSYQVADAGNLTKNTATLPSEVITAPALGAALAIPRLTDKIGLRFSVDTILFGASVKQTKNLEDGKDPRAKAVLAGAGFVYRWKKAFDLQATYDLNYYRMRYGAVAPGSQRMHPSGNVSRSDYFHALTVGIAKAF